MEHSFSQPVWRIPAGHSGSANQIGVFTIEHSDSANQIGVFAIEHSEYLLVNIYYLNLGTVIELRSVSPVNRTQLISEQPWFLPYMKIGCYVKCCGVKKF